jgi:hypothetical protein
VRGDGRHYRRGRGDPQGAGASAADQDGRAAAHLEKAMKRIVEEAKAHRRAKMTPRPEGVPDW